MKGMTNALPVLIDASTLATKSDISDMETKTNANATFATKTALTTLQNATKVAVENFAITESADKVTITTTAIDGATSKSEDIPAVTDTMAGIVTPTLKKKWDSSGSGFKAVEFTSTPKAEPISRAVVTIPSLTADTLRVGTTIITYDTSKKSMTVSIVTTINKDNDLADMVGYSIRTDSSDAKVGDTFTTFKLSTSTMTLIAGLVYNVDYVFVM